MVESARTKAIRYHRHCVCTRGEHMAEYHANLVDELAAMTDAEYDAWQKAEAQEDMEQQDYHQFLEDGGIHTLIASLRL